MGNYLYYIIAILAAAIMFGVYFFVRKKASNKVVLVSKILTWVLFTIFFVWFLFVEGGSFRDIKQLTFGSPYLLLVDKVSTAKFCAAISIIGVWLFWFIHITHLIAPYFDFKVIKRFERIVTPIFALIVFIELPLITYGYSRVLDITIGCVLFSIELGLIIGKMVYQAVFEKFDYKIGKTEIVEFVLCLLGGILFTMPDYVLMAMFGNPKFTAPMQDFYFGHRMYIYFTFIFLIGITLLLRNRKGEFSRMAMLFIALGGMISFSDGYGWRIFIEPYGWPLHICNTAMFILPLALTTRSQKIFYFTFFVNILGAMLATFMPTYGNVLFFTPRTVHFYTNHILAMCGPLVCVFLEIFPRPKKRQFFYSMVGFTAYFILVLFCNTVFSAVWPGREIDFFFINSDFVAKKVHAEFILTDFALKFDIKDKHFVMYPLYQVIYYAGFILMSIGMWYVYAWLFKFQDAMIALNQRRHGIKMDELALKVKYGQKEVKKCMNEQTKDKLVINDFGKRYTESAPFAVRHINFEAHAGEIIGFLGPNGAGKSTTIKAIVGIHLPTEGHIEVNGFDVAVQPVQAKSQIGFVPDHYALYENLTGREYLNYIADLYGVSKKDRDAFMEEFLTTLAMRDAIDNKIQTYSHGMKQKIAIMASIIHNPKVWILDEPLTGLDPVSIFQVKQCLKRHAENGNIVFFSSHLIDIVEKLCDRIMIISNHEVRAIADVKELMNKGVNLEQYYMEITGLETGN